MTFAWPYLLWLLLVPAALAANDLARRRRIASAGGHPKILRAEAGAHTISVSPTGAAAPGSPRVRGWLWAGLALGIVALARPQWGQLDEPVFDQAREILIAVDLSRSMLSTDVKPSRLDRAKLLVESLLDHLSGERVGLEAFAGTAFLQAPLSPDYEILREFLPALGPDLLPVGGTDYGSLIDTAVAAFGDSASADRFLIVLSDGGATDDDWRGHIAKLKAKGVRVIGLGIGTAQGALIPDGAGGYVKDERGAVVKASLESDTLRELAEKTGGTYRDASDWVDLPALLRATIEAGRKGRFVDRNTVRQVERFQWALAPALLCLLLSFWREFPVKPTPRDMRLAQDGTDRQVAPGRPPASVAVGVLLALLACRALAQGEAPGPDPAAAAAPLAHIVSRLSNRDLPDAHDWAELSSATIDWGRRVQSANQPVPAGPLHDGLAAVDAGSSLDAKAADWPRLRSQLEELLRKPEQPPPPQQQKQPQPQQQNQQQSSQQNSEQSQGQGSGSQSQQQQQEQQQQQQPGGAGGQNSAGNPPPPSAFGNMNQPQPPPQQPESGTQKVGGTTQRPPPESADPALAGSVEKLDQVRDRDSPAELFRMIENNNPRPLPKSNGKDW
jgi:Ca-activated chloride channel family protein